MWGFDSISLEVNPKTRFGYFVVERCMEIVRATVKSNGSRKFYMADLLSVVVGGVVAAGSGGAAQWLLHRQKVKDDDRKRRAAKLEELVSAIYEYDHWLDAYRQMYMFGHEHTLTATPYWRVYAVTVVYFPQLLEEVTALDSSAGQVKKWVLAGGQKRLRGETENLNEGFEEVYQPYAAQREALLRKVSRFADSSTNSTSSRWSLFNPAPQ